MMLARCAAYVTAAAFVFSASCSVYRGNTATPLVGWAERYLSGETEVDLTTALAELSDAAAVELVGGSTRVEERLAALEDFIRRCADVARGSEGPAIVEAILSVMFDRLGFEPVTDGGEFRLMFPDVALKERRGSCLGLAGLLLTASQRLKAPVSGVLAPGHFFARYDDGRRSFNMELLRKGLRREDAFYREFFEIHQNVSYYLRPLSLRETLAVYLFNVANAIREHRGDITSSRRLYEFVLIGFPAFAESRGNLAVLLIESGEYARAATELGRALGENPALRGAHLNLGVARRLLGDLDGAEDAIREGLRLQPEFGPLLRELGELERARGHLEEAQKAYSRAIELDPSDALAHSALAELCAARGIDAQANLHREKAESVRLQKVRLRHLDPW